MGADITSNVLNAQKFDATVAALLLKPITETALGNQSAVNYPKLSTEVVTVNTLGAAITGAAFKHLLNDSELFHISGGIALVETTGSFPGYFPVSVSKRTDGTLVMPALDLNGNALWSAGEACDFNHARFSFVTDAVDLVLRIEGSPEFKILVDDAYLNNGAAYTRESNRTRLTFTTKKTRKITVEKFYSGIGMRGVELMPTDYIAAPAVKALSRVAFVADSFGVPVGVADRQHSWPALLTKFFGFQDVMVNAHGGTGFINNGNGTKYNFLERIQDLIAYKPDIVFISPSINDSFYSSVNGNNTLVSAVSTYLQALKTALPYAVIIVIGVPAVANYETDPARDQPIIVEQDVISGITSSGVRNVHFIPVQTAVNPPVFGTGDVGTPTGDGNADFYRQAGGSHYTDAGQVHFATFLASKIMVL